MGLSGITSLLRREYWGLKSNTLLIVIILLFPMAFGLMFGTFKNVLPKNAPAALFSEGASEDDMRAAIAIISYFAKPSVEGSFSEEKLSREDYYFYVAVPGGFARGPERVDVYVDASMSPVSELSPYVKDMISYGLSKNFNYSPEISIIRKGREVLSYQYFVPGIAVLLSAAVGLLLVPLSLSQDKGVLRRVLGSVSTLSFASSKLLFAILLTLVQLLVLSLTQLAAGTPQNSLLGMNPWSIGTLVLASIFFASLGMSVAFLTRFGEAGKQINAGLLGFTLAFSGAFYPVGFFPALPVFGDALQAIGRNNPAYYFTIMMRGFGLRGLPPLALPDFALLALAFTTASLLLLFHSIRRHRNG